jgi:hypothetical protein
LSDSFKLFWRAALAGTIAAINGINKPREKAYTMAIFSGQMEKPL